MISTTLTILATITVVLWKSEKKGSGGPLPAPGPERVIVFFLLWNLICVALPYLAAYSPSHAMSARYLGAVWPFLAFIPVFAIRLFAPRWQKHLLTAMCVWQFVYGSAFAAVTMARTIVDECAIRC